MTLASERAVTLLAGATGLLGGEILTRLRAEGRAVRALLRAGTDAAKRAPVLASGAEPIIGDLKDAGSLGAACAGVSTVISTATSTRSRQEGDSILTVDEQGQLALVDEAARAGVRHFVFVSFPPVATDYALQRAKRRVEARLHASGMAYTILQPVKFCEVWLHPMMRVESGRGRPTAFGLDEGLVSWVSVQDVARFAVAASPDGPMRNRVVPLGGPEALTPRQVGALYEELGAPAVRATPVTRATCEAMLRAAKSPFEEAYVAGMLACMTGQVVDPAPAAALVPRPFMTVREFVIRALSENNNPTGE